MNFFNVSRARTVLLLLAAISFAAVGCGGSSDATSPVDSNLANSADSDVEDHDDEGDDHDDEGDDHDDEGDDHDDEGDDHDDDHDDHGDDHDEEGDDHDEEGDDHDDDHGDDHDDDHDEEGDDHDETSSGLGSHVHGAADLFVAWSGSDVVIDLISPSNNIFGFEYEPETDEEIELVSERTRTLSEPGTIAFNDQAECSLGDVDTEVVFEGSHAEVTTSWLYVCANPGDLTQLDLTVLFSEFPGLEDIDAQWASDNGQSAAELTASSPLLRFE